MSRELRTFTFTIPAGTAIAAPVSQQLAMPPRRIAQIDIRIPPGPQGFMGFAVMMGLQPIIPFNQTAWVVTDDEAMQWPLSDYLDSGSWAIKGYNTGIFPHSVYLRFHCDLPGSGDTPASPPPISAALLDPVPADAIASFNGLDPAAPLDVSVS